LERINHRVAAAKTEAVQFSSPRVEISNDRERIAVGQNVGRKFMLVK